MIINRTTYCSFKFANPAKLKQLDSILLEYGRVVNFFIDKFWEKCPSKAELLKPIIDLSDSWFSHRLRKVAAREAIDMVLSVKKSKTKKKTKPVHKGNRICASSTIAALEDSTSPVFDAWLHMSSIGRKIKLYFPVKFHKHFLSLKSRGKRLASYIIFKDKVQFCFEINTGEKREVNDCIGIDTGINALASLSTGEQYGEDIKACIDRINRCKKSSKGQKKAIRALKQRMDEISKQVTTNVDLIVVENLKGITQNTKRRLDKNMRRSIAHWNVGYWLTRLKMTCEDRNVSYFSVSSWKTSQICSVCGYVDRGNRKGEKFCCLECGHEANADVQASQNILARFLTGPYGAGCKPDFLN